ncbi:MAG: ComF family protein [Clostridia bacterium]|nr:ComF family protein [Clostridia bacterium]
MGGILSWLYVPKCTVCKKRLDADRTVLLCDECLLRWEREKGSNCPICGQKSDKCWCGIKLDTKGAIYAELHLSFYSSSVESVTKCIILSIKYKLDKRVADMLSYELAEIIERNIGIENTVIVHVPRSVKSIRYYGFDQSLILADEISQILSIPHCTAIIHKGKTVQKKLSLAERQINARKSYFLDKDSSEELKGKDVILFDDVVTTGATAARCASLIKRAGAKRVFMLSIAKVY